MWGHLQPHTWRQLERFRFQLAIVNLAFKSPEKTLPNTGPKVPEALQLPSPHPEGVWGRAWQPMCYAAAPPRLP